MFSSSLYWFDSNSIFVSINLSSFNYSYFAQIFFGDFFSYIPLEFWSFYFYLFSLILFILFLFSLFFFLILCYTFFTLIVKLFAIWPFFFFFFISLAFKLLMVILGAIIGLFFSVINFVSRKSIIPQKFIIIYSPGFVYLDVYGFLINMFLNFIFKLYFYASLNNDLSKFYVLMFNYIKWLSSFYTYTFYFMFYFSYFLRYYLFLILNIILNDYVQVRRFLIFEFYIIFFGISSLITFIKFIFYFFDALFINSLVIFKTVFLRVYFLLSYFFKTYFSNDAIKISRISGSFLTLFASLHWPRFFVFKNLKFNIFKISILSIFFYSISFVLFILFSRLNTLLLKINLKLNFYFFLFLKYFLKMTFSFLQVFISISFSDILISAFNVLVFFFNQCIYFFLNIITKFLSIRKSILKLILKSFFYLIGITHRVFFILYLILIWCLNLFLRFFLALFTSQIFYIFILICIFWFNDTFYYMLILFFDFVVQWFLQMHANFQSPLDWSIINFTELTPAHTKVAIELTKTRINSLYLPLSYFFVYYLFPSTFIYILSFSLNSWFIFFNFVFQELFILLSLYYLPLISLFSILSTIVFEVFHYISFFYYYVFNFIMLNFFEYLFCLSYYLIWLFSMLVYNLKFWEDICSIKDSAYLNFVVLDLLYLFNYDKLLNFLDISTFSNTFFDYFYFHGYKPTNMLKDSYIKDFDYFFTNSKDIANLKFLEYTLEFSRADVVEIASEKKKAKTIYRRVYLDVFDSTYFNLFSGFNNLDFYDAVLSHRLNPLNNGFVKLKGYYRTRLLYILTQQFPFFSLIYHYLLWVLVILSLSILFSGFNKLFFESRSFFDVNTAWSFVRKEESEQSLLFFNTLQYQTPI